MLIVMKYPAIVIASMALGLSPLVSAQNAAGAPINDRAVVLGILAAEFSLQSGDLATAASTYFEVAKRSQDAKVAERAVELLMRSRRLDDAKEIAALWQEADPNAARPHQVALALALTSADEARALSAVKRIAALPEAARAEAIVDAGRQLAQHRDRDFSVKLASVFTEQLPALAESQYALAVASTGTSNSRLGEALIAIDRALAIKPNWPQAVAVKSRLLLARAVLAKTPLAEAGTDAVALLEAAISANPDARELRLLLARTTFDLEKFVDARKRFLALAEDGKEDADEMRLAATLSSFQGQDWEVAEREFLDALAAERGERVRRPRPRIFRDPGRVAGAACESLLGRPPGRVLRRPATARRITQTPSGGLTAFPKAALQALERHYSQSPRLAPDRLADSDGRALREVGRCPSRRSPGIAWWSRRKAHS